MLQNIWNIDGLAVKYIQNRAYDKISIIKFFKINCNDKEHDKIYNRSYNKVFDKANNIIKTIEGKMRFIWHNLYTKLQAQ